MTPPPLEIRSLYSHLNTPTRSQFFEAINRRRERSKRSIYREFNIPHATAYWLLQQRNEYGKLANCRSKLREYKKENRGISSSRLAKVLDEALHQML